MFHIGEGMECHCSRFEADNQSLERSSPQPLQRDQDLQPALWSRLGNDILSEIVKAMVSIRTADLDKRDQLRVQISLGNIMEYRSTVNFCTSPLSWSRLFRNVFLGALVEEGITLDVSASWIDCIGYPDSKAFGYNLGKCLPDYIMDAARYVKIRIPSPGDDWRLRSSPFDDSLFNLGRLSNLRAVYIDGTSLLGYGEGKTCKPKDVFNAAVDGLRVTGIDLRRFTDAAGPARPNVALYIASQVYYDLNNKGNEDEDESNGNDNEGNEDEAEKSTPTLTPTPRLLKLYVAKPAAESACSGGHTWDYSIHDSGGEVGDLDDPTWKHLHSYDPKVPILRMKRFHVRGKHQWMHWDVDMTYSFDDLVTDVCFYNNVYEGELQFFYRGKPLIQKKKNYSMWHSPFRDELSFTEEEPKILVNCAAEYVWNESDNEEWKEEWNDSEDDDGDNEDNSDSSQ